MGKHEEQEDNNGVNDGPNAVEMLREDHRKVQELFEEFENADHRSRPRLAEQVLMELEVHTKLEEGLLYPAIREVVNEEALVDKAREEHHVATLLIKELRKMQPRDERYSAKFQVLAESVQHHIEEEESQLLPQIEELDIDLSELGQKALAQKEKLMAKGSETKSSKNSRRNRASRRRNRRAA